MKDLLWDACTKKNVKNAAKTSAKLLGKVVSANETKQIIFPILKGAAVQILKDLAPKIAKKFGIPIAKRSLESPKIIATLLDPRDPENLGNLGRSRPVNMPGVFVGVMHTSDVNGDPESRYGNVDVYSAGGRLQPGCYKDENNITQCNVYQYNVFECIYQYFYL